MKRLNHLGVAIAALVLTASAGPQVARAATNVFSAHLTGSDVVPAVQTRATGEAKLTLSADGATLNYRLNVANIDNVTQASLHLGMPGQNGEVVAILFGPVPAGGGRKSGVLAEGAITQSSLMGSLSGHSVSDLIAAIRSGNAYIDVATTSSTPGTEQKPGDASNGEIRGQVR